MKKNFILPLLLLTLNHALAGIGIISDLDDTIKITNAGNPLMASYNGILKTKVFTGMPSFMQESRSYIDELFILTTSPFFIRPMVFRNFKEHDIEVDEVILKTKLWKSSFSFKVGKIKSILDRSHHDFILIGDDVNADVEVFDEIIRRYPKRVIAAYIHVVKAKKKIPSKITPYFTSLELAVHENLQGRMSDDSVYRIIEETQSETRLDRIFPKFAHCPRDIAVWDWMEETPFGELSKPFFKKFSAYCSLR